MNCCERKKEKYIFYTLIISLILILLMWNVLLTILISNDNSTNSENEFDCYCVEQMQNIVEQIARLYPNSELFITLDGGDAAIGTPGKINLVPNGKSGTFQVKTTSENITQIVSICSIDAIILQD